MTSSAVGVGLLIVLAVCSGLVAADRSDSELDLHPPAVWLNRPTIRGDDRALVNAWGHVTAVSLIRASSLYSRNQASRLEELRHNLTKDIGDDERRVGLHVIGINSRHWPSSLMASELLTAVNFTVYQSTNDDDYWSRLGGHNDDVFVYDRWGNLAYYVPFPYSYIPDRYVEAAILSAMYGTPCIEWPSLVVTPVNCSDSTDVSTTTGNSGASNSICSMFTEERWSAMTSRHRHSTLAARCWRRRHVTQRPIVQHPRHRIGHPNRQQRHDPVTTSCVCLSTSSGNVENCLCRRPVTSSVQQRASSNCLCSMLSTVLNEQCSWHDAHWPTATGRNRSGGDARLCSWPVRLSSESWSWHGAPAPGTGPSGARTHGFCTRHGQPLLWPQATWRWPASTGPDTIPTSSSWSWRAELERDRSPPAVRWSWPNHVDGGLPEVGQVSSDRAWSWSDFSSETAVGSVAAWEWTAPGPRAVTWPKGRSWHETSRRRTTMECEWRGQSAVEASELWRSTTTSIDDGELWRDDDAEWRRRESSRVNVRWRHHWAPTEPWSSADWQPVQWSWVDAEAASTLWRRAPDSSWSQQRGWDALVVPGWSWSEPGGVVAGQERTVAVIGWSTNDVDGWLTVSGWRWNGNDTSRLVVSGWRGSGLKRHDWRHAVHWPGEASAELAWGQ